MCRVSSVLTMVRRSVLPSDEVIRSQSQPINAVRFTSGAAGETKLQAAAAAASIVITRDARIYIRGQIFCGYPQFPTDTDRIRISI